MDERAFSAGQAFLLSAKLFWTHKLFGAVKDEVRTASPQPKTLADVAKVLSPSTTYAYFEWFERHLQKMKYSGRYGLVPHADGLRRDLLARLDVNSPLVQVDPALPMPDYYTSVDVHQHPGGVWSDELAGFVYEEGARSTTPAMGVKHADLHQRFTDLIVSDSKPKRILDMGCGFGKSTRPFYRDLPEADVTAVDLAAPCLNVAGVQAAQDQARNVRFLQKNAYETGLPAGSFDLVTSTMLLHEMPPDKIAATMAEAARVLAPGGRMVHLDFHMLPDAFARFIHYGHAVRNNEVYMEPWAEMDIAALLRKQGFTDVTIAPFAEADNVPPDAWRFPWTVISATKAA
jgi:ubiquinone/menaquinone biosynthesis C-methylase UbiE